MSKIDQLVKTIVKAIDEKDRKKTSALDTVATVSRIDGDTAWVKFAGSDSETPVKQTIAVKKGDKVQVRASKGSAWITGNITSPPTDNTLAEEAVKKSDTATKRAKRAEDMSIVADVMYYLASDQDEGVTTEDEGWTQEPQEATVALPYLWCYHEYTRGNGTKFNSDPVIISRYTEGGAGVQSITTYYALGTSTSTAPTSGWATTFSFRSGYYIWRKELISLTDGTTTWSAPVYDGGLTEACELAFDAAQYIWTQPSASATTSVPSGQYVTEVDKDSYRASPTGGALLLRSTGAFLRYATQTLVELVQAGLKIYEPNDTTYPAAQFLSSGAVIGKENSGNLRIASGGFDFYNGANKQVGVIFDASSGFSGGSLRSGGSTSPYAFVKVQSSSSAGSATLSQSNSNNQSAYVLVSNGNISLHVAQSQSATANASISYVSGVGASLSIDNISCDTISCDTISPSGISNASTLFDYTTVTKTISSVGANASGEGTSSVSTKTGWYPLAITNVKVTTGVASLRRFYFDTQESGKASVTFGVQNDGSSAKDIACSADVLWVKTTA